MSANEPAEEWVVYEDATGVSWTVTPPTRDRAIEEATLAGQGHSSMPVETARLLQNAFAHGRMYGHAQAKSQRQGLPADARGDGPCMRCGTADTPVWFTDNATWNWVLGGDEAREDPGGFLCPICFVAAAHAAGLRPVSWRIFPEFKRVLMERSDA